MTNEYPVSKQNKVRQIREYAVYDRDAVHGVLDSATHASVGFVQDGQPVVVPMIHGREGETIFLHGARKARVIRLLEQTEALADTIERARHYGSMARDALGIFPVGAVYLFSNDRNVTDVGDLAGKRIATFDYDKAALAMVERAGS